MPKQGRIENTIFPEILREFGIVRNAFPFELDSVVVPVALVATGVEFVAAPMPAYRVNDIFTAGVVVAPAAGTVLADTLALPIGAYTIQAILSADEGTVFTFEWRNVGNTASLWTTQMRSAEGASPRLIQFSTRLNIENPGERFRITNVGIGAGNYQVSILARI